jgi:hypothetical protein
MKKKKKKPYAPATVIQALRPPSGILIPWGSTGNPVVLEVDPCSFASVTGRKSISVSSRVATIVRI